MLLPHGAGLLGCLLVKLTEPFSLGRVRLPDQLVMAPMTRSRSPRGVPGDDVAAYYRRRVEGGVGLIIAAAAFVEGFEQ